MKLEKWDKLAENWKQAFEEGRCSTDEYMRFLKRFERAMKRGIKN